MDLCSDRHEEIAYEGRRCPVCVLIEEHRDEIGALLTKSEEDRVASDAEIDSLRHQVDELTAEAADLRSQVLDLEAIVNSLPRP